MSTTDDGFHEIQLSGKQLVFMFMAVTVVSVVIFLCGVLVGRGVRVARETPVQPTAVTEPAQSSAVPEAPPLEAPPAPTEPAGTAPPAEPGAQDWQSLMTGGADATPALEPVVDAPAAPSTPAAKPGRGEAEPSSPPAAAPATRAERAAPATPSSPRGAAAVPAEPTGPGFSVQVAALAEGSDAEALVRRLIGKGYQAYLVPQSAGQPQFRVRVGKFRDRREAERVSSRLAKEEKFSPWVLR